VAEIQVLEKHIANKISAGEVVEKPASVVKELVENSLDAGANSILIEIENGGIDKITIIDNGKGIDSEDVKTAFLPHATSKIKTTDDLFNIGTLGFRGEALASISAVSEIEMTTKTKETDIGTFIKIAGGDIEAFEERAANTGTKIVVKNLFFNTPARKKFLRKPKLEESEITHLVQRLILANPTIKFKYITDGKMIYNTLGSGCYDNIYTIYGKEIADNIIEVNYSNHKYTLTGYIGKPKIAKPNRTFQTLFINKRIVTNFMISSAVGNAYESFLMKGKFPFYVLNLTIPNDAVDVNVHPTKQEVKFDNTGEIYSFFLNAISDVLFNLNYVSTIDDIAEENEEEAPEEVVEIEESKAEEKPVEKEEINFSNPISRTSFVKEKEPENLETSFMTFAKKYQTMISQDEGKSFDRTRSDEIVFNASNRLDEIKINSMTIEKPQTQKVEVKEVKEREVEEKEVQEEQVDFAANLQNFKVVGTIFSTYIILEADDKMYMIDQHACHERKNYDKFVAEFESQGITTQPLMIPYVFTCSASEFAFFIENQDTFKSLGFEIDEFGQNTLKIYEIPYFLSDINLENLINDIRKDLGVFNKNQLDFLKDSLAKKACKASVKAGDTLTKEEISALLHDLEEHKVLLCPHGRPVVVEITKSQIEKWFKRKL